MRGGMPQKALEACHVAKICVWLIPDPIPMLRFGMRLPEGAGKVIRVETDNARLVTYPSFHAKNEKMHDAPLS